MTNTGTENPSTENDITVRSSHVPAFAAARTPSGTAIRIATTSVLSVSETVGSTRCAISCVTGRLVKIDVPRSPCNKAHSQPPKRTRKGSSSPSRSWMRRMSSSVAISPAITAAGSPGVRYRSEKTTNATTAITATVAKRRRTMRAVIRDLGSRRSARAATRSARTDRGA